jgi:hypothetical protein
MSDLPDEYQEYLNSDKIDNFEDLNEGCGPESNLFQKFDDYCVYYNIEFSHNSPPQVRHSIIVDIHLHVKLFFRGSRVPLPEWFRKCHSCKLTRKSQLQNFAAHIEARATESSSSQQEILEEMSTIQKLKPKGRPPFSATLLRLALMTRYTSKQAYNILLEELPLPSISMMQKLNHGGIEPIKALKFLLQEERVDDNVVLLVDEMYLQKSCEYHSGQYIGKDENGDLYNGIVVFMVVGLRKSVPFVIKCCPKIKFDGEWLADEISESITTLSLMVLK